MAAKKRKFVSYNALEKKLRRNGFKKSGHLATLLLNCFVHNGGILTAKTVESSNLCAPKKFKQWRDDLVSKQWLIYNIGDYSRHFPGNNLVEYINQEKLTTREIATTMEMENRVKVVQNLAEETSKELEGVKKQMSQMQSAIDQLINEKNPPITKGKQKMFVVNPVRALSDPDL